MKCFYDTNVLIYAFSDDSKTKIARQLISGKFSISAQVINEFVHVARRKYKKDWNNIDEAVSQILDCSSECVPLTVDLNKEARRISSVNMIPFYDALIIAAALEAKCDVLVSEDFQCGQRFGTLTIQNPFV